MDKLKIAILFGGCSEEHDISIKSAKEIAHSIDRKKYNPIFIGITKKGVWKLCDEPKADWEQDNGFEAVLSPNRLTHGLIVFNNNKYEVIYLDAIFPVLHGKMGEDGVIQGLLELSGVPYVGCNVQSSVIGMDKSLTYLIAKYVGITTPNFSIITNKNKLNTENISFPVFVKPAHSGSSFGISKVSCKEKLDDAIKYAHKYDSKVLIEEAISGYEVGCAVLGNGNDLFVGEVDQIVLSHGFFRIHQEAKPESGSENAAIEVPANISPKARQHIQETAKIIYTAMECTGLARVDMFLQEDGSVILNEVNTMPGCTCYSRYPRMMKAAGLSLSDIIDKVVELAIRR